MSDQLLAQLVEKYRNCNSYQDCGTYYTLKDGVLTPQIRFSTHFQRPANLRFEWSRQISAEKADSHDVVFPTITCQVLDDQVTLHNSGNISAPTPRYKSVSGALQFVRSNSKYITDVALSLLSDQFDSENCLLSKDNFQHFQLQGETDSERFRFTREFKLEETEYTITFIEDLHITKDLYISSFTQSRRIKREDKQPLSSLQGSAHTSAQKRWLSRDYIAIDQYRFEEAHFNTAVF